MKNINKNIAPKSIRNPLLKRRLSYALAMYILLMWSSSAFSQVIHNTGAEISVKIGTVVVSDTFNNANGALTNDGTIHLKGNYFNAGLSQGDGYYNLAGNWVNTGTFSSGTSTVEFYGAFNQSVTTGSDNFYRLIVNNSGSGLNNRILLLNNVTVTNSLKLNQGNVEANGNKLYLSSQLISSLEYSSLTESRIIGQFERGVSQTGKYLFPVGSDSTYNPLNLNLNTSPTAGSVLSEFIKADPGDVGLPITDIGYDSVEVYSAYNDGYWSLAAQNGFEIADYSISIDGSGFDSTIYDISRLIKRPSGGNWVVDGIHKDAVGTVVNRDTLIQGIEPSGIDYGIGHARPKIWIPPADSAVCDGESVSFSVKASGKGRLYYQWQVFDGSDWEFLYDGGIYSGTDKSTLQISSADLSMDGYLYRVIVTHRHGYFNISSYATLTVNPIPVASVSLNFDTLCNNTTTHIELFSTVPNSTFELEVLYSGSIIGASNLLDGDTIKHMLTNPGMNVDSVVYKITPTGPNTTYCVGIPDTVVVWVNPTPAIEASVPDTIVCNSEPVEFNVTNPNVKVRGDWAYYLTVIADTEIDGERMGGRIEEDDNFTETLTNNDTIVHKVVYHFVPVIRVDDLGTECGSGIDTTITIWVNPTPRINLAYTDSLLCDEDSIRFTTLTGNGAVLGDWVYDITIEASDISALSGVNGAVDTTANSFTQYLRNNTDTLQWVDYTFIPKIKNVSPLKDYCENGVTKTIRVWINPIPHLAVMAEDTIYCDTSTVRIDIENINGTVYGNKRFDIVVDYIPGAVSTSYVPADTDVENPVVIYDDLVNNTDSLQIIKYIFIPKIFNPAGNDPTKYCDSNGIIDTITIYLNPTPRINLVLSTDTVVCDTSDYSIKLTSGNPDYIGTARYIIDAEYTGNPGDVSGVFSDGEYNLEDLLSNTLVNNTKHLKIITYNIKPVFRNVNGHDPDCDKGIDTTIRIYLNPTPVFDSITISDTVICNESMVQFTLYNTQITTGNIIYELNTNYSESDVSGVEADGSYSPVGYPETITNTLINSSLLIQSVLYHFNPKIDDPIHGILCDNGIQKEVEAKVVPTLSDTAVPLTYKGGWNIKCHNEENGRIDLSPTGGYYLQDYEYTWTKDGLPFDQDAATIENLTIGSYVYRIEDYIGCYYIDSLTLYQPDAYANDDSIESVLCSGYNDGKIFTHITGGTPVYDYIWDGPRPAPVVYANEKTDSLVNIYSGIYFLTLKDSNLCMYRDTFEVLAPFEVSITPLKSRYGDYNISCTGLSNGSIESNATGGTGTPDSYTYLWEDQLGNPVSTDANIYGVKAGTYFLNVADSIGCTANAEIQLTEPDTIRIDRTGTKYDNNFDISCYGFSDGIINIIVAGSHTDRQNLFFNWEKESDSDFSEITKDLSGLTADKYKITVTDTFECVNDTEYLLIQPDEIVLNIVDTSDYNGYNISCNSLSDAWLDLTVSGGFGGFQYEWTTMDGSIAQPSDLDQNDLPAGNYTLRSTDEMQCFKEWDFNISEPDSIDISPVLTDFNGFEVSCYDGSNGGITLNTNGGVSPYNNAWTGGNSIPDTEDQSGLIAGDYQVEVRDLNDCSAKWDFVLNQPDSISTSITPQTITCYGTNNGSADLEVSGGVNPYTFFWSNGETSEDIDSLFINKYIVEVRDLNNCLKMDSSFVTEPLEIIMELESPLKYNGKMISCYGESDADINSSLSGGVGTYDYYWSNGETTPALSNVPAGVYTLEVVDDFECHMIDSIEVFEPQKLIAEVYSTDPTCYGKNDGRISLIIQGGTPEYSVNWNGLDQTGPVAEGLYAGKQDIVVTDLNLCRTDTFAVLEQPDSMFIIKESDKTYCPDISDGRIEVTAYGGTYPYTFNWNNGDQGEYLDGLMIGTYILELSDENQCVLYDTTYLESANISCLELFTGFTPNGDGYNDTWEIGNIELYPDATVEIFNRWGEMIFRSDKAYDNPWDGTYKGRELPIDSYHFVINLGNGRDPVTGNVTIIR